MSNSKFITTIFLIALGAFLGYYGNVLANRKNNELLVQMLKDALDCTNQEINDAVTNQSFQGRTSTERMEYLVAKRADLENKLSYYSKKYNYYV